MDAVNALNNAAKFLQEAAKLMQDADNNPDVIEYADERIALGLAELLAVDYSMEDLLAQAEDLL